MKKYQKWVMPRNTTITDPRLPIAKHINWNRALTNITDFCLPEPDNYNYAVFNPLPWECPILVDQIFYKDKKLNGWWSVYYVPEEQREEFLEWAEPLPFQMCWHAQRSSKLRHRRTLLWAKPASTEQTIHERLYTMGYYDNLQTTFNIDISATLGEPRLNMPGGEYA